MKNKSKPKNLLLLFEGSQSDFEQIRAVFASGQLGKLLGVSVLDVGIVAESQQPTVPVTSGHSSIVVRLSEWFENLFESDWLPVDRIPSPAYRGGVRPKVTDPAPTAGSVSRAKVIDLGMQISGQAVALVVRLVSRADGLVDIYLRCYPAGESIYLPPGLQLLVLDDSGATVLKSQARNADIWLQLDLEGQPGGRFSAEVRLGDFKLQENFVI